jgi:predicted DsbA family dithiol-disulfide isomerase
MKNNLLIAVFSLFSLTACGQEKQQKQFTETKSMTMENKMKIEIWSDIMCPFCYIGKRNFEAAMAQFPEKENIEVEWKSFQLDPSIPEVPLYQENIYQFVAARKGISYEQSVHMHQQVLQMAKNAGLEYYFDKALVTNSQKAHRLIQFAKTRGLGANAEERLFFAYFTQGKNLSDTTTLIELGKDIGLTDDDVKDALTNPVFQRKVEEDGQEASKLGAKGVPFFVVDRKYAISGAHSPEDILETLKTA